MSASIWVDRWLALELPFTGHLAVNWSMLEAEKLPTIWLHGSLSPGHLQPRGDRGSPRGSLGTSPMSNGNPENEVIR